MTPLNWLGSTCPRNFHLTVVGLLGMWLAAAPTETQGAISGLQRVASGLSAPIFVTHAPGDSQRLFIAQRGGAIRILNLTTGTLEATPFLSIPSVDAGGEGGLLGLAFHPDYATNGKFYTYSTHDNGGVNVGGATSPFSTHIRQYAVSTNPNIANPTATPVLSFPRPQDNHVGGWIGFSPNDDYLYIASGDGGGGGDTGNGHTPGTGNAQDITDNFFGKMLRIDVNGDDFPGTTPDALAKNYAVPPTNPFVGAAGDDEIWSYGLRNPFRDSFDRATGDLWIGDVGQGAREEIDFQSVSSDGGENYGWRLREGTIQTPGSSGGPAPVNHVGPVYDYDRDNDQFGGSVVTGGYVYRGPDPTLQGKYFFADSRNSAATSDDNYWMFDPANPYGTVANIDSLLTPDTGSKQFPASFGEDANGNLYLAYIGSGDVFRINTDAFTPGDFNGDASVDGLDLDVWEAGYSMTGVTRTSGDADGDGDVDGSDFMLWQQNVGWSALDAATQSSSTVPEPASAALLIACVFATMTKRRLSA
jgi:glucose/arabinose dehydrogenase